MGRRTPVNVEVIVYDPDSIGRMIKKFTRKVKKCGILDEVHERRYYTKRSDKNRAEKKRRRRLIEIENEKRKNNN
jgi:ribosomal protein S21|tara:strand:+ start:151 stop:375 length:225 start_codon:yes stop_codon:yes gene_type:complete